MNNCNCGCNTPIRVNGSLTGVLSNAVLRGQSAYELAVQNGFEGTLEEWLDSLKADNIELKSEENIIYYKYANETEWHVLLDLSANIETKVDKFQGEENVDKVMVVGADGNLIPKTVETLQFVDETELDETLKEVFG